MGLAGTYLFIFLMLAASFGFTYWSRRRLRANQQALQMNAAPKLDEEAYSRATAAERPILLELTRSNLTPLVQHIYELRAGRWDERSIICELTDTMLDRQVLNSLCAAEPNQPIYALLRGAQSARWAWQARGHGSAQSVSKQSFSVFEERMELARHEFLRAARLAPEDPTPYAALIPIACHVGQPEAVAQEHLAHALQRDPENYAALINFLTYHRAPHWGGTAEGSLSFARQAASQAPVGSCRHMLVAASHKHIWHNHQAFGSKADAAAHIANPEVQREVMAAYMAGIGSPAHVVERRSFELYNLAAWWFFMLRDQARCAYELQRMGDVVDGTWSMLGPSQKQVAAVRAWALRGAPWQVVGY